MANDQQEIAAVEGKLGYLETVSPPEGADKFISKM